jgi:non-ribosomal peptide synthetase component F
MRTCVACREMERGFTTIDKKAVQPCCVHCLIEDQVRRTPDALAVVYQDSCLTYRELDRRARDLAKPWGIGPEVLVGLYMPRCQQIVIYLLAILKAGGAFVPRDPTYLQERLHSMLSDAAISIVLTHRPLQAAPIPAPRISATFSIHQAPLAGPWSMPLLPTA